MIPAGWGAGPLLLGHRGDPGAEPENTLEAFAAALDAGAGGVELDIRLSRDGVPVAVHDPGLERTTGARRRVAELSWAELSRLDAGAAQGRPGRRIPRLEQVLELVRGRGVAAIELKEAAAEHPRLAATVLEAAARTGTVEAVMVLAFDHAHLGVARAAVAGVPTVALLASGPVRPDAVLAASGAALLGPPEAAVDARLCAAVHAAGAGVLAWTVDDPTRFDLMLAIGCDVIVSNRPGPMAARLRRPRPAGGGPGPARSGPAPGRPG